MASQAQIASQATIDVGGEPISSIDHETQIEAALIREIWDTKRDELFSEYEWAFAKEYKALALESEDATIDEKWIYVYALPADYIMLLEKSNDFDHEVRDQSLYCDVEDLIIGYIKRITDTSKYPVWFNKAMSAILRPTLSLSLAKKGAKAIDWDVAYDKVLAKSMEKDARQDRQSDDDTIKHTTENDSWVGTATS